MKIDARRHIPKHVIDDIIRDVCELPDYCSPADMPDVMMCTGDELERIIRRHLDRDEAAADGADTVLQVGRA